MTRIIQRCLLVLAFTGVLLSSAQETTQSEATDFKIRSSETPTSALENNFNSESTSSFYSSTDKTENTKNTSVTEVTAVESSSYPETTVTDISQKFSKVPDTTFSESNADDITAISRTSSSTVHNARDDAREIFDGISHSEGLYKAGLNAEATVTEPTATQSDSYDKIEDTASNTEEKNESDSASVDTIFISKSQENKIPTEAAVNKNGDKISLDSASSDSGQSTVPLKEELVYNASYVDENQSLQDITSTAPSKVQNDEIENNDTKSATHKRSLNATNSIVSSTAVMGSNEANLAGSSLNNDTTPSEIAEHEVEISPVSTLNQMYSASSNVNHASLKNEGPSVVEHDILSAQVTSSPHSIPNDNPDVGISAGHIIDLGHVAPESSSSGYLNDASLPPVSSDALSILNEESIHPLEGFDSEAQIANIRHITTMSSIHLKSPGLEVEYGDPISNSKSPVSLVTFDPDGMTNNYTQDPDSVTFSPKVSNRKPTEDYFSNLEREESHSNKPELLPDNVGTVFDTEELGNSSHDVGGFYSSEREREIPPPNHGLLPHDEPDREELTSFHMLSSTKRPEIQISTSESKSIGKDKTDFSINNESEEMLNDSPHFIENQNGPTVIPTLDSTSKVLNKNLENNISNDITHTSDVKFQDIRESHHELDFPIEYQTQQSEIRPVTAASPTNTSGSVIVLSNFQTSNETKTDVPVSIINDTSSPVIQPNPAPSFVKKSFEKIMVTISPEMLPKDYVSPELLPKDYVSPELLPKDYVPPDLLPKDYVPPKVQINASKEDNITAKILPKTIIPLELLPKDYLPSDLLPKDYVPTEMLPKDYVPSELLPKDYVPPELLPKDYVPSDVLPKDYTPDQFEQGNSTDTNVNSTIAGVAVKTSVSVSLPLSKSSNDTTNTSGNSINKEADERPLSTITTGAPTTESKVFRILKPKLKIDAGNETPVTGRTRKPFLPSLQKSSTTAGPPVSIFRQARTRLASITSSTTQRPFPQFSTIRVHYASRIPGMVPGGEMVFSVEPITTTTTIATTTETEEPFSDEPFTGQTIGPVVPTEDNVTLLKVAGVIVVDKGLRWNEQLNNRLSPQYKEREKFVQSQLYRLFRTSPIAPQLWKIQIDGFSGKRNSKSVVIDFFLYLIKSHNEIKPEQLVAVFHDKLINNTFSRFVVDTNKTTFEFLNEELMRTTTPPPEVEQQEPVIPQWAIAVIVVGAASLIFIVLFAAVAVLGRHHVRRRYGNKLNDEDSDRPSDWESKMAAAYENLAADTIYDAEDFHNDSYKKSYLVD